MMVEVPLYLRIQKLAKKRVQKKKKNTWGCSCPVACCSYPAVLASAAPTAVSIVGEMHQSDLTWL